ncbi:helix-turn-helix domain-containing protein [Pedobacter immunditicola]|uniref:helix-turn-helix domain-containing protein n=1 Tax=Pedobacter immunditicola TaxID=3133440 RepID=UPI0030B092D6
MTLNKDYLILERIDPDHFKDYYAVPFYNIFLLKGKGMISADFVDLEFDGQIALFTTPYQHIKISGTIEEGMEKLSFHGDFYCIEYHKKEVACNGLLFNNIYQQPFIYLIDNELNAIFEKIEKEKEKNLPFTEPILKSYLQLILAVSSRIKKVDQIDEAPAPGSAIEKFRDLLEENFIQQRSPLFYANALSLAPNSFTKQCTKYFGKSPSILIQERVILEAKKHLHLSYKSIKEIAGLMNFDDQHYFSRYFKKYTGVSPTEFRADVGISIVADLSII